MAERIEHPNAGAAATSPPVARREPERPVSARFSWPMRIFLFVLLFDMVTHSLGAMFPWREWGDDLGIARTLDGIPTRAEYARLRAEGGDAIRNKLDKSLASARDYFNPWPSPENREKLGAWDARGRYAVAWLCSRLDFVENVCGIRQEWRMFSPNIAVSHHVTRARLVYADGSERVINQTAEPADLTRFTRWNKEKILDFERDTAWEPGRSDECWGWCNRLCHCHGHNDAGSPLKTICLYCVRIDVAAPGEDVRAALLRQMALINDRNPGHVSGTFYTFDVEKRSGVMEK